MLPKLNMNYANPVWVKIPFAVFSSLYPLSRREKNRDRKEEEEEEESRWIRGMRKTGL